MYWLQKHIFLCETSDHVVLLDLKRDAYVAVSNATSSLLHGHVKDWPCSAELSGTELVPVDLIKSLLEKGVLTENEVDGKSAEPLQHTFPQEPAIDSILLATLDPSEPRLPSVRFTHVATFLFAHIRAKVRLRFVGLGKTIASVSEFNSRDEAAPVTIERVQDLIRIARQIRPFVYTTREKCLLDTLTLIEFLNMYGFSPSWIFAVQTRPFYAHCWAELSGFVLNDTPGHIGTFTPILRA